MWQGFRAHLDDFIDGEEGQKTATEVLFDWAWEHFRKAATPSTARCHVRQAHCPPVYLQWAGHAVCIVGAVKRQFHKHAAAEKHLLIFNPERRTSDMYEALTKPMPEVPEPYPAWWCQLAWSALRALRGPRILLDEAIAQSAGQPGQSEKGPGGENGPYQTLTIPHGWVCDASESARVRQPEDACTQHVGNQPALVLAEHMR